MRMFKCDVCGRVMHDDETSVLDMFFCTSGILYKHGQADYNALSTEKKKDLCKACAIKIARIVYPCFVFPDEEEYKSILER